MAEEKEVSLMDESIQDFNWDNNTPGIDFFGEKVEEVQESKEVEKKPLEKTKEKTEEEEESEEKVNEDEIFGDFITEDEKESSKETKEKKKEDTEEEVVVKTGPSAVLSFLKENDILELEEDELKEFEELDDIEKAEALKDYFDEAVEARFTEAIKELPDSIKNIIKFHSKGGDVNELLNTMYKNRSTGINENLSLDDENSQELLVRQKLQEEEYDEDYITSQIEYLKDSDKLKITAEKYFKSWKKNKADSEAAIVKRQEDAAKLQRAKQVTFKKEIAEQVSSSDEIKGFKLSKKDQLELPDYLTSQNIKLEDGRVITPFYRDLFEAMKDKGNLILMAKLLRNKFDFSSLEKSLETKKTRELKENVRRQEKTQSVKSNNGSSQKPKKLIDLLDE